MTLGDFERVANELIRVKEENKQLKEQLSVANTNEETFRLEMEDITKALRLDKGTLFDDVKVYARSLKDNLKLLKKENYELKKKLEESKKFNNKLLIYNANIKFNSKRFIKYLEDERKRFLSSFNTDGIPMIEVELLDVVLENYKKIMGLKRWKKK